MSGSSLQASKAKKIKSFFCADSHTPGTYTSSKLTLFKVTREAPDSHRLHKTKQPRDLKCRKVFEILRAVLVQKGSVAVDSGIGHKSRNILILPKPKGKS